MRSVNWYHEVSTEWLKARRFVITATEVSKLVPAYKRFQKAGDPDALAPEFAALWAEKHSDGDPDPSSYGPAARGHICEPWAVRAWNLQNTNRPFYHWDDCIIARNGVGFSPDAADVPQLLSAPIVSVDAFDLISSDDEKGQRAPREILEIKSYDAAHHMKCCIKDRSKHDELMQLAVPFIVCPTIDKATLVFFNPNAPVQMKAFTYTRDDLKEQIRMAELIIMQWERTCRQCEEIAAEDSMSAMCTEDEIYDEFLSTIPFAGD